MKLFKGLAALAFLATIYNAPSALALSFDSESMSNRDGSAKFADPEENIEKNFGAPDNQAAPGFIGHNDGNDQVLFGHFFQGNDNKSDNPANIPNQDNQSK